MKRRWIISAYYFRLTKTTDENVFYFIYRFQFVFFLDSLAKRCHQTQWAFPEVILDPLLRIQKESSRVSRWSSRGKQNLRKKQRFPGGSMENIRRAMVKSTWNPRDQLKKKRYPQHRLQTFSGKTQLELISIIVLTKIN